MDNLKDMVIDIFFNKVIKDVLNGEVNISNFTYNIEFNTVVNFNNGEQKTFKNDNENVPTLYINNYNRFCEVLLLLANEIKNNEIWWVNNHGNKIEEKIYCVLCLIWANATYEDFDNPILFFKRYINFLKDKTFSQFYFPLNIGNCLSLNGYSIIVRNNEAPGFLETPHYLSIKLQKFEDDKTKIFTLPNIMYGIDVDESGERVGYIYTIQNPKDSNESEDLKKIKRELYKVNDSVYSSETEEYKEFKSGLSEYYPENISDVTPSALIALSVVIGLFKSQNINIIKAPDFLPIRWFAKEKAIEKKTIAKIKKEGLKDISEYVEFEIQGHESIQRNITEKFIRTFRRIDFHFNNIIIENLPSEGSSFLQFSNNGEYDCNNKILDETYIMAMNYGNDLNKKR